MSENDPFGEGSPTNFSQSPDAEVAMEANGKMVDRIDHPDATDGQPVTDPVANQTPMAKPMTDAPAFAGPDNADFPTPAEQAAPTEDTDPLKGIEVDGPSPVLGAPIGVNPIVPQVASRSCPLVEPVVEVPAEMTGEDQVVPMIHPDGGETDLFETVDGKVMVPHGMIATMIEHGFELAIERWL